LLWIASGPTTVTFVPIAARIVVAVVANAVAYEEGQRATSLDAGCAGVRFGRKRAVAAFALFAVIIVIGSTAISSIPSAAGIVVVVIACLVTFPGWLAASSLNRRGALVALRFVLAIQALALFAVF